MPTTAAALDLHHALYRRQKAEIDSALRGARSPALQAYERRYLRRTREVRRTISVAQLEKRIEAADVIYVGDYHTLPAAQRTFLAVVEVARVAGDRPAAIALEFVEGRHQKYLDAFLAGRIDSDALLRAIGRAEGSWGPFVAILEHARAFGLPVIAIDAPPRGADPLKSRDLFAARQIARALRSPVRPRVVVLTGQFHVVPCHLPAEVRRHVADVRELVVYQNCEHAFWQVAEARKGVLPFGVELADETVCLFTASPVSCQQSFLDHLEGAGELPIDHDAAEELFRALASKIARVLGVNAPEEVGAVEVATAGDPRFLDRLRRRGRFSDSELEQVRKHVLDRQSCYWPRAKMAYLASLTLEHAAEEAAHFVRHLCVDDEMAAPRRPTDAFYARCLEEALGFLGSRLVHPGRRCPSLAEYAEEFERGDGEARAIAAFVLAHKAAEAERDEEVARMLPLRRDRLFHGVSHGLGYLLGDAWHRAYGEGTLTKRQLRALFRDPFRDPRAAYFANVTKYA